jgi:hypothetical protein
MPAVYLASGLGFSQELRAYLDKIKAHLNELGCSVLEPWERPFRGVIEDARGATNWQAKVESFRDAAHQIDAAKE